MPDFFPPCLTLGYVRRCCARSVKVPLSLAKSGNVRHRVVGTVQNCMFTIIQAQCLTYSTNRFPLPYVFFNGLVRTAILVSCEYVSFCPRQYRNKESIISHKKKLRYFLPGQNLIELSSDDNPNYSPSVFVLQKSLVLRCLCSQYFVWTHVLDDHV